MNGLVVPEAYAALRHAMSTADPADFDAIPRGGVAKLSNPQSAFAFQMDGADSHQLGIRVPPAFASAETAGEMAVRRAMSIATANTAKDGDPAAVPAWLLRGS